MFAYDIFIFLAVFYAVSNQTDTVFFNNYYFYIIMFYLKHITLDDFLPAIKLSDSDIYN